MQTVLLLTLSNIFMTFAWYGHLKYKDSPLWLAVLVSWLIAFVEYCFQVPANRIGYEEGWSGARLKIVQEVITLGIFAIFSILYLKEQFRWNYAVGFALMVAAVVVIFGFKAAPEAPNQQTVDPTSTAIKSADPPSPV
jgi:uncharacterized protein (DUF486 family)